MNRLQKTRLASIVKKGRILFIPDVHVPYHDRKAWNLVLKVIKATKPDMVVQLGDFGDVEALSSHPKSFGFKRDFDLEMLACRDEWDRLQEASGDAMLVYTAGNHEHRLLKYVSKNAPMVEGIVPSIKDLFGMDKEVIVNGYQDAFHIGRVQAIHDIGYHGKFAAQRTLDAAGHCIVFGHTHRLCVTYSGSTAGERWFALNCGWLGDVTQIKYLSPAQTREWALGFGIVDMRDGLAYANPVAIVNYACCIDGRVYR